MNYELRRFESTGPASNENRKSVYERNRRANVCDMRLLIRKWYDNPVPKNITTF